MIHLLFHCTDFNKVGELAKTIEDSDFLGEPADGLQTFSFECDSQSDADALEQELTPLFGDIGGYFEIE